MKRQTGPVVSFGKKKVGGDSPCYIVAEIGINFDGKFDQAVELIKVAAAAKCDAVKFQLFTADQMYPEHAGKYRVASGEEQDIGTIVKDAELPPNWMAKLKEIANSEGLDFFSSVFDERSVDILETYNPPAYKIASYELTHLPLLEYVAKKDAPMIVSTGGGTMKDVAEAIETITKMGKKEIVLMHCIAKYPAPLEVANLNILTTFQMAFPDLVIGYSDHTSEPVLAPVAAVLLGAKVLEKHITLDRKLPGPDHSFALNPTELIEMVAAVREAEKRMKQDVTSEIINIDQKVLGSSERKTFPIEKYVRDFTYRGIFAIKKIKKGELFTRENTAVLRPGENKNGIHPRYFGLLIGSARATQDIPASQGLSWADILQK